MQSVQHAEVIKILQRSIESPQRSNTPGRAPGTAARPGAGQVGALILQLCKRTGRVHSCVYVSRACATRLSVCTRVRTHVRASTYTRIRIRIYTCTCTYANSNIRVCLIAGRAGKRCSRVVICVRTCNTCVAQFKFEYIFSLFVILHDNCYCTLSCPLSRRPLLTPLLPSSPPIKPIRPLLTPLLPSSPPIMPPS